MVGRFDSQKENEVMTVLYRVEVGDIKTPIHLGTIVEDYKHIWIRDFHITNDKIKMYSKQTKNKYYSLKKESIDMYIEDEMIILDINDRLLMDTDILNIIIEYTKD